MLSNALCPCLMIRYIITPRDSGSDERVTSGKYVFILGRNVSKNRDSFLVMVWQSAMRNQADRYIHHATGGMMGMELHLAQAFQ